MQTPHDAPDTPEDLDPDETDDPGPDGHDTLTASVFHLAGMLARRERRHAHRGQMQPHRGKGRVLAILALRDRMSQKDLAYLLGVRPQSLGELLSKLENADLVRRSPDPDDRRTWTVELTDTGREMADTLGSQADDDPFDVLSPEQQQQLAELLGTVITGMWESEPPRGAGRIPKHPAEGHPPFGPPFGPLLGPPFRPPFGPRGGRRRGMAERGFGFGAATAW
jgi:DNA-binding MarR family transcriptional regulator